MIQSIAIDGPAGAGKSTIAKKAAKELSFTYVDTGAMFRAMAVYMADHGIAQDDEKAISSACDDISIEIEYEDGAQQIILNGVNVTGRLREERIGNMTSAISVYPAVRTKLLELQRQIAATKNVIMDGRDIGTCVLPDAVCKIYLTASVATRAKRRYDELVAKGIPADMEDIKKDIEERDYRDMHRDVAPLKQADDAVLIDSSDMDIEQVTKAIIDAYNAAVAE
ncbi:MAG: (d)CMP kinase [Lachnospiraceae bacterium]|nr:(d)CMP kinase [Lachnospiraceae bacterium]